MTGPSAGVLRPSRPYRMVERLSDGMFGLEHPRYGRQLWLAAKTRGRPKPCAECGATIAAGAVAYRPVGNGGNGLNRMERLCAGCIGEKEAKLQPAVESTSAKAPKPTTGRCFHCKKSCNDDYFCSGCKAFVCDSCDVSFPMGFGHAPEDHLASKDDL